MISPDEARELLEAIIAQYRAAEIDFIRFTAQARICGLNATEIRDLLNEHRDAATASFMERNRR